MEPNRSSDAVLIILVLVATVLLVFGAAAGILLLRSRGSASVVATAAPPPTVVTVPTVPTVISPPTVSSAASPTAGTLAPQDIASVVRRDMSRIRGCYDQGLKRDPSLSGKVAVRIVIETDGHVSSASKDVGTTLTDATVIDCVMKIFKAMTFTKPEGGPVTVAYPIVFSAAQ